MAGCARPGAVSSSSTASPPLSSPLSLSTCRVRRTALCLTKSPKHGLAGFSRHRDAYSHHRPSRRRVNAAVTDSAVTAAVTESAATDAPGPPLRAALTRSAAAAAAAAAAGAIRDVTAPGAAAGPPGGGWPVERPPRGAARRPATRPDSAAGGGMQAAGATDPPRSRRLKGHWEVPNAFIF